MEEIILVGAVAVVTVAVFTFVAVRVFWLPLSSHPAARNWRRAQADTRSYRSFAGAAKATGSDLRKPVTGSWVTTSHFRGPTD